MKTIGAFAAGLAMLAGTALADEVDGTWQTQVDDGAYAYIEMGACGDKICGVISRTFNSDGEYQSENIGKQLVWDMVAKGNGEYRDGQIWQPSTDNIYRSKMSLDGDILRVSGCVVVICKKQTWARIR